MSAKAWRIYYFNEFFYQTMYYMFAVASVVVLFLQYIYFRNKFLKYNIHRFLLTPLFEAMKFVARAITVYGFVTFFLARNLYRGLKKGFIFRKEIIEEYKGGALLLA